MWLAATDLSYVFNTCFCSAFRGQGSWSEPKEHYPLFLQLLSSLSRLFFFFWQKQWFPPGLAPCSSDSSHCLPATWYVLPIGHGEHHWLVPLLLNMVGRMCSRPCKTCCLVDQRPWLPCALQPLQRLTKLLKRVRHCCFTTGSKQKRPCAGRG